MFILDDIEGIDDSQKCSNIPGGAGTYAMLGAAICADNDKDQIHWIVDEGYDFPCEVKEQLSSWPVTTHFRLDQDRETTRGLNYYPNKSNTRKDQDQDQDQDQDLRLFKFLTPKVQIKAEDWVGTFGHDAVEFKIDCFHLVCSAARCKSVLDDLGRIKNRRYTVIWEPLPTLCDYEHLTEFQELFSREDIDLVFSPNAEEASRLLSPDNVEPTTFKACQDLLDPLQRLIGSSHIALIRCGRYGSIYKENDKNINFPAYHYMSQQEVKDPTGGGNAYLGGFALVFGKTKNLKLASICGNISAGCAIEQVGIPKFDAHSKRWNDKTFKERLQYYIDTYELNLTAEKLLSL